MFSAIKYGGMPVNVKASGPVNHDENIMSITEFTHDVPKSQQNKHVLSPGEFQAVVHGLKNYQNPQSLPACIQ